MASSSNSTMTPMRANEKMLHPHEGGGRLRQQHQHQQQRGSAITTTTTESPPLLSEEDDASEARRPFITPPPPGSAPHYAFPPKEQSSVKELLRSARNSFGDSLQPREGYFDLVPLDYPVRKGPPRTIVTAQDWDSRESDKNIKAHHYTSSAKKKELRRRTAVVDQSIIRREDIVEEEEEQVVENNTSWPPTAAGTTTEISVMASAPGKVILFGEYAVEYGKPAVGAALSDLRIFTTARCTVEASLVLELPDLDVCFRRTAYEVVKCFGSTLKFFESEAEPAPPAPALLKLISVFVGEEWGEEKRKAMLPLVFLGLAIVPGIFLCKLGPAARGLSITAFGTSLPVGAGLGFSAALCVATSAALTRLSTLLSQGNDGKVGDWTSSRTLPGSTEALDEGEKLPTVAATMPMAAGGGEGVGRGTRPSPSELELINSWAYAGETVLHGTPSGLDSTVSCYGGAIKFVKVMGGEGNETEPIPGFLLFRILLTTTRLPKDTRELVAKVHHLLGDHPGPTVNIFDAIGAIATEFLERTTASAVKNGGATAIAPSEGVFDDGDGGGSLTAECVGELVEMNHRLLYSLGVGHPALERVCEVARVHGCKSKLTGGGGCALTILPGDESLSKDSLVQGMISEGFECYETCLGGDGVLWHNGRRVPPEFDALGDRAKIELDTGVFNERVKMGVIKKRWRDAVVVVIVAVAAAAAAAAATATARMASLRSG